MRNKKIIVLIATAISAVMAVPVQAADLQTLFTTPDERQLINSNRYKTDEDIVRPVQQVENEPETSFHLLVQEEVTREFIVSGITVSRDGSHMVWINSETYEDGEQLEGDVQIKVLVGDEIRVRLTAPDGKHYYALSGETLQLTYMAPMEN